MHASFNIWTTLFLLAAHHGLVLGVLVWRRNDTGSSHYLAFFLLLFSVTPGHLDLAAAPAIRGGP